MNRPYIFLSLIIACSTKEKIIFDLFKFSNISRIMNKISVVGKRFLCIDSVRIAFGIIIFRYHSHAFAVIILILVLFLLWRSRTKNHSNVRVVFNVAAAEAFAVVIHSTLDTLFDILSSVLLHLH